MGWTYEGYIVPKNDIEKMKDCDFEEVLNHIQNTGIYIIDEGLFDRSALGRWSKLNSEQHNSLINYGYCKITVEQLENAVKVLKELDEKVRSMPFSNEGPNENRYVRYDETTHESIYEWHGPKENYEIYKIVSETFAKEYHYRFPWKEYVQSGRCPFGATEYREALEDAVKTYRKAAEDKNAFPEGIDIILFSY